MQTCDTFFDLMYLSHIHFDSTKQVRCSPGTVLGWENKPVDFTQVMGECTADLGLTDASSL